MTKFTLKLVSEDSWLVSYSPDLRGEDWTTLQRKISCFPEISFKHGSFHVPMSLANIDYLKKTWKPEEYVLEKGANAAFEYLQTLESLADMKMKLRSEQLNKVKEPTIDIPCKKEPRRYQKIVVEDCIGRPFFGILTPIGSGKSKCVIDTITYDIVNSEIDDDYKCLIICPQALIWNWIKEFNNHLIDDISKTFIVCGSQENLIEHLILGMHANTRLKVYLININKFVNPMNSEALASMNFDLVVLDESTNIKNPRAKCKKGVSILTHKSKKRVILTGSLSPNSVKDVYAQFDFLYPGLLGFKSYESFVKYYTETDYFGRVLKVKNFEELQMRIAKHAIILDKKEILSELPPVSMQERRIEMGKRQRELYTQMVKQFIAELSQEENIVAKADIILVKMLRLHQISNGFLKCVDGSIRRIPDGDVKLNALLELLEENPDEKATIWTIFLEDIRCISEALLSKGIKFATITGETSSQERFSICNEFNTSDELKIILSEPRVAGYGLDMLGTETSPCSLGIYYGYNFSWLEREQSSGRMNRIGQHKPVTLIELQCSSSIDGYICQRLQEKKSFQEDLLNIADLQKNLLGI